MIMSGVEDGKLLELGVESGDGASNTDGWALTIGRLDARDIRLTKDTFISREHAHLTLRDGQWWLCDKRSKNGTFVEADSGDEQRLAADTEIIVHPGQLFRVGRTWLRIEAS
jgi:pSer/pThr/pTyr-binding forkhead associated (FHA) protein